MVEPPPCSSKLPIEAENLYHATKTEISGIPYEDRKFQWGRIKSLSDDAKDAWKQVFADQYDIDDVAVSHFVPNTIINYEPHGILLVPFSDVTLQPLEKNNTAHPNHKEYKVTVGSYTYLSSIKTKVLSGEVDMLVAKLNP